MGNSFIGFPVPRAKIADMITGSAPPIIHHDDHESGGNDEVDCTGLAGAGGVSFPYDGLVATILFTSIDGFSIETDVSGDVRLEGGDLLLTTGATQDSRARLEKKPNFLVPEWNWGKSCELKTRMQIKCLSNATGNYIATIGYEDIYQHIGFKVSAGKLYGTVGDGSDETALELQTLGAGAYDVTRELRARFTAGSKCEFYVDGIKLGTITTNLPSGAANYTYLLIIEVTNPGTATTKQIRTSSWHIWQEA